MSAEKFKMGTWEWDETGEKTNTMQSNDVYRHFSQEVPVFTVLAYQVVST